MGEPHLHIVVSPEGEGSVVIMALLEELTRGTVSGKQNRAVAIGFQNPDGIQPYYLTVNGLSEPAHRQNHIPATRVPSRSGNHDDQIAPFAARSGKSLRRVPDGQHR